MANQKFPQIGLRAVFDLTGFTKPYAQYQRSMRDANRITQRTAQSITQNMRSIPGTIARTWGELTNALDLKSLAKPDEIDATRDAFTRLGWSARVNVDVLHELAAEGVNVYDAMKAAGGAVAFNLDAWEQLVNAGAGGQQAFNMVTDAIARSRRQMALWSAVTAAATVTLRALFKQMREAIKSYDELAETTRRLSVQTGLLTKEASSWVTVSKAMGISTTTSERALTGFLGKVTDLHRELEQGATPTNDFAKAMDFLGISLTDNQDNLKSTAQLMEDVSGAFQRYGAGQLSATAANDLFGYSGRFLLPLLADQEQSFADLVREVESYGAELGALDRKEHADLLRSQIRLRASWQAMQNTIGRGWTQARTNFNNFVAGLLKGLRKADAAIRAFQHTFLSFEGLKNPLKDLGRTFQENYQFYLTGATEAATAAEKAAQATANQIQREAELARLRRETLRDLDALKQEHRQKLDDIDRDAERKWDDIFLKRFRDALARGRQEARRMKEIGDALIEQLDAIDKTFAKRWDDILVKRQRDAFLRGVRLARRYEDLARSAEKSRQDTLRDFAEQQVKLEQDTQRRLEDADRDAQARREELERDHRRRLAKIQRDYLDTVTEAARSNDAVAVAQAMRERAREIRDERDRFTEEQRDLAKSLQKKRADIARDRQRREADHQAELARELKRIEENYKLQRAELVRENAEERALRNIQYQWELDDFNAAKAEQKQAARDAGAEQIAELKAQAAEAAAERVIQYAEERADFEAHKRQQIDDAKYWYTQERDELATHLGLTGAQLEGAYDVWMQEAASAASEVAAAIGEAMATEIERYQHTLTAGQRQAIPQRLLSGAQPRVAQRGGGGVWSSGIPGIPTLSMAEGGIVQASSPTNVVMGDGKGPETGIFVPGRSSSMNVSHSFDRLGVDFAGLPGGLNTQQVLALVYGAITQVAKGSIKMSRN